MSVMLISRNHSSPATARMTELFPLPCSPSRIGSVSTLHPESMIRATAEIRKTRADLGDVRRGVAAEDVGEPCTNAPRAVPSERGAARGQDKARARGGDLYARERRHRGRCRARRRRRATPAFDRVLVGPVAGLRIGRGVLRAPGRELARDDGFGELVVGEDPIHAECVSEDSDRVGGNVQSRHPRVCAKEVAAIRRPSAESSESSSRPCTADLANFNFPTAHASRASLFGSGTSAIVDRRASSP